MTNDIPVTASKIIAIEKSQLGYREGRDASGWNNDQKFSDELPGFKWSDKHPWCATFQCWAFWAAGVLGLIPKPSASCDILASGFKAVGQWSTTPRVGSLGFLGKPSDLVHVFMVTRFDATYVYTLEGNTNDEGSREGYEVAERKRLRSSVVGYGHPKYPAPRPLPETELSQERARLTAWRKRLGTKRPRVRAAIDAFLKGTPKR